VEIQQTDQNVVMVSDTYDNINYKQDYLLISDVHFDSKYCDKTLLKKHLDQAIEKNAKIIIGGDFFDCMQTRNDKRGNKADNDYYLTTYFNEILEHVYEFLEPYKDSIIQLGYGNHETSIIKHSEIDLTKFLAFKLNVIATGYSGFIIFKLAGANNNGGGISKMMFYHHGFGGNAPRTKGMLNVPDLIMQAPEADLFWVQHKHNIWYTEESPIRIGKNGKIYYRDQQIFMTSTYKDDHRKGVGGWAVEKGMKKTPFGGWWLKLRLKKKDGERILQSNLERAV
jgi:hypothetical protein